MAAVQALRTPPLTDDLPPALVLWGQPEERVRYTRLGLVPMPSYVAVMPSCWVTIDNPQRLTLSEGTELDPRAVVHDVFDFAEGHSRHWVDAVRVKRCCTVVLARRPPESYARAEDLWADSEVGVARLVAYLTPDGVRT
jgi:hypothetical protein